LRRWSAEVLEQVARFERILERDTSHKFEQNKARLELARQNRADDRDAEEGKVQQISDEITSVTDGINKKTTEESADMDNQADKIATKMQTAVKTVKIDSQAAWMGLNVGVEKADGVLYDSAAKMRVNDKALFNQAKELNWGRVNFEVKSDHLIDIFQTQVKSMQNELTGDLKFLSDLQGYTLRDNLETVLNLLKLLAGTANHADKMYDTMMDKESAFMDEALHMQDRGGFSSMRSIQQADEKMHLAVKEDSDIVKKLFRETESQLAWMNTVLETLDKQFAEHEAGNFGKNEKDAMRWRKVAGKLEDFLGQSETSVGKAYGGEEYSTLGNITNETVALLKVAHSDMGSTTNQGINTMNKRNDDLNTDAAHIFELADTMHKDDAELILNSSKVAAEINSDVRTLADHTTAVIAHAKQQNQERASNLLDKVSGVDKEVDDGQVGSSLVQGQTPRMAALLAQTARLSRLHAGLDSQHDLLGAEVAKVAKLGRQFRES